MTTKRGIRAALIALVLATGQVGAACGSSSTVSQPAGSIKVVMTDFKFDPASINTPAGKVVLFVVNSGGSVHDLAVVDSTGKQLAKSDLVQPGNSSVLTVSDLKAGTYKIVCTQPGHEAAGMKGTLTAT